MRRGSRIPTTYFGSYLADPSWASWKLLLIAILGEELTHEERVVFTRLTGRPTEPTQPVRAFFGIVGRRGGKSRAMSILAAYLAALCDHRAALAPGKVGILPILAASTKQAGQLFKYVAGVFDAVPAFAGMVKSATGDTLRLTSGVEIRVQPASWRTVRSITAVSCICDELAMWRNDDSVNPDAEILAALKPALLTTGGMLDINSITSVMRRDFGSGQIATLILTTRFKLYQSASSASHCTNERGSITIFRCTKLDTGALS